ncbi:transposase [Salinimicrobium sp. MT39]|uniref:Transposase n=1 Tax=Salinimicrobium profundisediminis TaxID=2994553 RepID=A0A9X3CYJ9_9FLAO|nr:transposase [Salinimicrobium profundisediminis]MCX2839173.1 transposase [Salinimicrobium profundisediminis]
MSPKSGNKFRNGSIRLQHWDYGWDAAYFITICTKDRKHFFGEVQDGEIKLSSAGVIANVLWYEILHHAKNVELGEFVVMPNHIHGIIILNGNKSPWENDGNDEAGPGMPWACNNPPEPEKTIGQKRFQNPGKNTISSIVGSYKSAVTKYANRMNLPFAWQSLFHDRIIRDSRSFQNISAYIQNNPQNWKEDNLN